MFQKIILKYEAISILQQAGIAVGTNGKFNPEANITRAQMAKILVLVFGFTHGGNNSFQDFPESHWSYSYVSVLANLGIIEGDNGKLNPNEPLTRAQFVAMMYRIMQYNQIIV